MNPGEFFLLIFVALVIGAIALALGLAVHHHSRKHPHGPHRPAKIIELHILPHP